MAEILHQFIGSLSYIPGGAGFQPSIVGICFFWWYGILMIEVMKRAKDGMIELFFCRNCRCRCNKRNLGWQKTHRFLLLTEALQIKGFGIVVWGSSSGSVANMNVLFWSKDLLNFHGRVTFLLATYTVPRLFVMGPLEIRIPTCSVKGIGCSSAD